jgi:hypothetical protein
MTGHHPIFFLPDIVEQNKNILSRGIDRMRLALILDPDYRPATTAADRFFFFSVMTERPSSEIFRELP